MHLHLKYQSPNTFGSKDIAQVKVRDVTKLLRNQRKTGQKRRKIPHPSRKNIIFCHFRSNPKHFVFAKSNQIGGIPLKRGRITSLIKFFKTRSNFKTTR
jgi:hypothetical protein